MLEDIKFKEEKKEVKTLSAKCPFCEKEIQGSTKDQIIFNLEIHIKAKHKIKKIKEVVEKKKEVQDD